MYVYTTRPAVCVHTGNTCTTYNGSGHWELCILYMTKILPLAMQSNTNQSQGSYFRRKMSCLGWAMYCIYICTSLLLCTEMRVQLFRFCNYYRFRLSRVAVIPCASPPPQGDSRSTRGQTVRETPILSSMAEEGMCLYIVSSKADTTICNYSLDKYFILLGVVYTCTCT